VQKSHIEVGVIGTACAHWWTRVHARSELAVYNGPKLQKIPENVSNNREDYLPNPLVAFCRSYLELIWYDHRTTG